MARLSTEQLQTVAQWFAAGASLDEIQKRIKDELGIHLTYLDVRLMVAELPQPSEPEPPKAEMPPAEAYPCGQDTPEAPAGAEEKEALDGEALPTEQDLDANANPAGALPSEDAAQGELSVAVDPLAPPGCIACGSVTFSDGTTGKWMLDQMGRLGLSGLPEAYRPSAQDNAEFQPKLVAALRARGLI